MLFSYTSRPALEIGQGNSLIRPAWYCDHLAIIGFSLYITDGRN